MITLLLASALLFQNPPPAPPPLPGSQPEAGPASLPQTLPLVPGAIPAGASAEARALWKQFCDATLAPQATRVPLTAFDLLLDAQIRNASHQSNETLTPLRYRFQQPEWVRAMTEHGYELLHGPKGDFLIDPKRGEQLSLPVGREGDEDRKQLAEIRDLARNFLALTDPAALRMAQLWLGSADPVLGAEAAPLAWLEMETPDFHMPGSAPVGMLRVQLGLRRDKSLPVLCLVGSVAPGARPQTLIRIKDYREKQGLAVPHDLSVFPFDLAAGKFPEQPPLEIWRKKASDLRPIFAPETFLPK
ncbi:MAG: hypothetical protein IPJ19_12440 [Planctomycetes bacterium]|nr:hypothetical protein [Planctomycetota bacterium]